MIKIVNLSFTYAGADKPSLKDVSFDIQKGSHVAILGHNGSGKTTLSKIIAGLYKASKGEMYFDGVLLTSDTVKSIRKKIGIVFQNPDNQFVGATVEDDIAFGLENKKISREDMKKKIQYFSKKVDMFKYLDHEPHILSGGQKQRVAIASTLALDPQLIIFDEITSMLDPIGKENSLKIMEDLKKDSNKTLISITHDMEEAVLADKIIVLKNGQVLACDKPENILSNENIIRKASLDMPFILKVSSGLKNVKSTFSKKVLIGELCK